MRKILLSLLLSAAVSPIFAQNAFFDAKKLLEWYSLPDYDSVKKSNTNYVRALLKKYQRGTLRGESSMGRVYSQVIDIERERIRSSFMADALYERIQKEYEKLYQKNKIKKFSELVEVKKISDDSLRIATLRIKMADIVKSADTATVLDSIKLKADPLINAIYAQKSVLVLLDTLYNSKLFPDTAPIRNVYREIKKNLDEQIQQKQTQIIAIKQEFSSMMLTTNNDIVNAFADDKQIQSLLYKVNASISERKFEQSKYTQSVSQLPNNKISTDFTDKNFPKQSEIIDALAIYLAGRFKQEVALTFVEHLKKYLDENGLVRELFPSTWKTLSQQDNYNSPKFGSEWRNSLSKDFIEIPENLAHSSVFKRLRIDSSVQCYLQDAVCFGGLVKKKYSFIDIMRTLYDRATDTSSVPAESIKSDFMKNAVFASYVINEEFFDTTAKKYWIAPEMLYKMSPEEISLLSELLASKYDSVFRRNIPGFRSFTVMANKTTLRVYTDLLGLLRQFEASQTGYLENGHIKDAFWDMQRIFIDYISENARLEEKERKGISIVKNAFFIYDYISNKNFGAAINSMLDIVDSFAANHTADIRYLNIFLTEGASTRFASLGTDIDEQSLIIMQDMEQTGRLLYDASRQYRKFGKITIDSLKKEAVPKYASFITDFFKGIPNDDQLNNALLAKAKGRLEQFQKQVYTNSHAATVAMLQLKHKADLFRYKILDDFDNFIVVTEMSDAAFRSEPPQFIKTLRQLTGFFVDASAAQNSKELSRVVEAYAMPTGSYKFKRRSVMSIDLNAYAGVFGAIEKQVDVKDIFKPAAGITAPLGVSFSWGKTRGKRLENYGYYVTDGGRIKYLRNNVFSIFISIIDIGAPFSYRLTNDAASGLPPEAKWAQILAPGVHVSHGILNTPLCVSLGMQMAPQLRDYKNTAGLKSTLRLHASILLDMPLFNLYIKKTPAF